MRVSISPKSLNFFGIRHSFTSPLIMSQNKKIIALFDVDGTLTIARGEVTQEMNTFLAELREKIVIGTVGGSDFPKQQEQLGNDVQQRFDYCFAENGLTALHGEETLGSQSFREYLGEAKLNELINFILGYLSKLTDVPVKRGTFIEYRNGMLNVSPIGRGCSRPERNDFEIWDKESKCRATMVGVLEKEFGERFGLKFSIGGQISFDVFPIGWDKTYCLQFLQEQNYDEIHFFGDKTYEGGNDYEIFHSDKTIGHAVTCPEDTIKICRELWLS